MAKVRIELDTENKTGTVSVNGTMIPNVHYVSIELPFKMKSENEEYGYFGCRISTLEEENGMTKHSSLVAKASAEGEEAVRGGAVEHECKDFVVKDSISNVQEQVIAYFDEK